MIYRAGKLRFYQNLLADGFHITKVQASAAAPGSVVVTEVADQGRARPGIFGFGVFYAVSLAGTTRITCRHGHFPIFLRRDSESHIQASGIAQVLVGCRLFRRGTILQKAIDIGRRR